MSLRAARRRGALSAALRDLSLYCVIFLTCMSLLLFCSCWKFGSVDWMAFMCSVLEQLFCLLAVAVGDKENLKLPGRCVSHLAC